MDQTGYVSYLATEKGNPNLVRYGYDSWGNICGQSNENLNISAQFAGRNMVDRPLQLLVVVLILLVMRKRIKLVVKLFKEAGRVITHIPLLILQPIWTLLILMAAVAGLLVIALYIETSKVPYLRWYHIFGIFWISAFIVACQDLVIAGAVSIWYFTRNKTKLGCPIGRSTCNLIRYHIGSVAFGSFLIALVRFVRFILMIIQKKLKGKTNKFAEFIMKMLACCLWCFERFLKFINRNAYIMIAIHGDNFCNGARKALVTIVNNALRVIAINTVGDFLLFLSKLGCVALVLIIGNELLPFHPDLTYKYVPLTFGGVIAFAIAHCFMLVYEIVLDTLFMCFCEDCDMNNGNDKPYFMSRNLMTCVSNIETFKGRSPKSSPKSPRKK
ncbi:choline transporter-like protein 1 [Patella vulgata]|uniref:choline transporter-like protein 1 n=1 Tax=Patella vulgata TaxID=6465 RepID=UPI0024A80688|nr:choline transporter-like protein 1 [Patella vulgata]